MSSERRDASNDSTRNVIAEMWRELTGGEIIDGETGDPIDTAHADYPNVETPEWPGREIDLKPLTNVTIMWDPSVGEDSAIVVETPELVHMNLEDDR